MPHHKSQMKSLRKDAKRRLRNRAVMSQVRSMKKKLRTTTDVEEATALLPRVVSVIDKATKKGVLKKRTADRNKSRLTKYVGGLARTE